MGYDVNNYIPGTAYVYCRHTPYRQTMPGTRFGTAENTTKNINGFPHVSVKLLANVCLWMTSVASSRAMAFRLTHVFSPSTFSRTPAQSTNQQGTEAKRTTRLATRSKINRSTWYHTSTRGTVDDFDSPRHNRFAVRGRRRWAGDGFHGDG